MGSKSRIFLPKPKAVIWAAKLMNLRSNAHKEKLIWESMAGQQGSSISVLTACEEVHAGL